MYIIFFQDIPKQRRPRQKSSTMSKYRRKTANAKERERMKQVNDAFERLRVVIPNQKVGFQSSFDENVSLIFLILIPGDVERRQEY